MRQRTPRGVPDEFSWYLIALLAILAGAGFIDTFATSFRYTMITYVRADFGVELSEIVGLFSWIFVGSSLSFIPRALADVFGRRILLFSTMAGLCVLQWLVGFARTPIEYAVGLTLLAIFYRSDIWLLVISEEAPPRHRGSLTALMAALAGTGSLALGELIKRMGSEPDAWRSVAQFPIFGVLLAVPILFFMRETRPFRERAATQRLVDWRLLIAPFHSDYRTALLVVSGLKICVVSITVITVSMVETDFLRVDNGFEPEVVGWLIQASVFAAIGGWIVAGLLSDRIGRRPCCYLLAVVWCVSLLNFALLPKGSTGVMVFSVVHNFAFAGVYAILRVATMELFPDGFRATASAWTDLFTVLCSAVTSRILSSILATEGISTSAVIVAVALVIPISIPFYQLLPETRGRRLEEV